MNKKHRCRVCGGYGVTDLHHIFGGRFRQISDRHGFLIELCRECHHKAHHVAEFGTALKHDAELEWLEEGHTLDEWMEIFGRTWVTEDEIGIERAVPDDPFDDTERPQRRIEQYVRGVQDAEDGGHHRQG